MKQQLSLLFLVLTLSGCGKSLKLTLPPPPVNPPAQALIPCELPKLPETGMNTTDVITSFIQHRHAIYECEMKRKALVEGWPK